MRARSFNTSNTQIQMVRPIAVSIPRVITKVQAEQLLKDTGEVHTCNSGCYDSDVYVFVDSHGIPPYINKDKFTCISTHLPHTLGGPHPEVADGIIDTIDKYLLVYHGNQKELIGFDYYRIHKSISAKEFLEWYAWWLVNRNNGDPDPNEIDLWADFSRNFDIIGNVEHFKYKDSPSDRDMVLAYIMTNYINDIGQE